MNQAEFRDLLSTMPALRHSFSDKPFMIGESEVVLWALEQPGVLKWLFERMKATERIEYDDATKRWRGRARGPVGRPREKVYEVTDAGKTLASATDELD